MSEILDIYPFRILDKHYPDLINYKYNINISHIDINLSFTIIEHNATGKLYYSINNGEYIYPLRYYTNLLPSIYNSLYYLYYDYSKQTFIFGKY